jgi:predicted molibdopterin-dependent oxidoreductase YjgC
LVHYAAKNTQDHRGNVLQGMTSQQFSPNLHNLFPDCSNMCHETTSVGLSLSIAHRQGYRLAGRFRPAEVIFSVGHNPDKNHPQMMTALREASNRGAPIIVLNLLRARWSAARRPRTRWKWQTFSSTPIASACHQLKVGGGTAVLKGIVKAVPMWITAAA